MKLCLILISFFNFALYSQCPIGRIELYSQVAIDEFKVKYPNCTEVSGGLLVQGADITNLNGLNAITKIDSSFIVFQTSLKNMLGLYSLRSVGYLAIGSNGGLTTLTGLERLQSAGCVDISYNAALTSLRGLESLVSVTDAFELHHNDAIKNLIHLNDALQIGGIRIESNSSLEELEAFNQVTEIKGNVIIADNGALKKVKMLSGNREISGRLAIGRCENLESITGLENIAKIDYLYIYGCWSLKELPTMKGLVILNYYNIVGNKLITDLKPIKLPKIIELIEIGHNIALQSLEGMENLEHVEDDFSLLSGNDKLKTLKGLDNLKYIGGELLLATDYNLFEIDGFPALKEVGELWLQSVNIRKITGLTALTTVRDSVHIWARKLQRMDGLMNLREVTGGLFIFSDSLETLSGLDNIDPRGLTSLNISNSRSLNYCSVPSICAYLSQNMGPYTIGNNKVGCNNAAEILASCTTVATSDTVDKDQWSIYPNPCTDELHLGSNLAAASIRIYDAQGRAINIERAGSTIHTHTWPAGIYIVQYLHHDKMKYSKVMKQ